MRSSIVWMFENINGNSENSIVYYQNKKRNVKTFSELSGDIEEVSRKINYLNSQNNDAVIGILGQTSYLWMVLDLASIKCGVKNVAIPEFLPITKINEIVENEKITHLFVDYSLREFYDSLSSVIYYNCEVHVEGKIRIEDIEELDIVGKIEELILEDYSTVFSSGTSNELKYIKRQFKDEDVEQEEKSKFNLFRKIKDYYNYYKRYLDYKKSFMTEKYKRLFIFMPFSHPQQREFVRMALMNRIDIVLSDSNNFLKHLVLEKPNVMVSIPVLYERLAANISMKLKKFKGFKKVCFNIFNFLGINKLHDRNIFKKIFSDYLFKDIRKIYGGKATYFITGSAPIDEKALQIFYSIGVRIYEAYGTSEIGTIAMNSFSSFKIGSVGKPGMDVKISKESEILVKYDDKMHIKENVDIDDNGYMHTGDLGRIDNKGFLYVFGRMNDTLVFKNGKKIFPANIELKFKEYGWIDGAIIIKGINEKIGVFLNITNPYKSKDEDGIKAVIETVNKGLADFEQIRYYQIIEKKFTVENGYLTATGKMKRSMFLEDASVSKMKHV